jgi:hypothetical protein
MRDSSPDAATPALGYASIVISACVVVFLGLVAFIFWLSELGQKAEEAGRAPALPAPAPAD